MKIQINSNTLKRIIASGMMVITMMSLAGCEKQKEDSNIVSSSQIITEEDSENKIEESLSQININSIVEKSAKENLIDKLNRNTSITNSSEFMYENYKELYKLELNDQQLELASYAYNKLKQSNVGEELYLKELNNVLVEQLNPRGLSDEKWQELFGTLLSTLNEKESVYDTYFILARLIHETECNEQHYLNEYDIYSCEFLEKEYNLKYSKVK